MGTGATPSFLFLARGIAMTTNIRYLRYRDFTRFRYSEDFLAFLSTQAARLIGTGTPVAFVVATAATGQVTITGHTFSTGAVVQVSSDTALPAGLATDTNYWLSVVDANTVAIHGSIEDAQAGLNPIDLVDAGTGTHSIENSADAYRIFEAFVSGKTSEMIRATDDIDDL